MPKARLAGPTLQRFTLIVEMAACWCMAMTSSCLRTMDRSKPWNSYSRASTRQKVVSVIGDGNLQQEAVILNRIVRYVPPNKANRMAMEIEPDQRHVDILLREHGLDHSRSKGVDTPSEEVRLAGVRRTGIAPSGSRRCAVIPFGSYENLVLGTGPCGRSRGSQVSLASHAKSNAGGPCRAQTGSAVLVEISACSFGL